MDSIAATSVSMPPPPRTQSSASLTDTQNQLINETLGQFDSKNLTTTDAQSIVATFQEAGIQPGKALAAAMENAGFDARAVGDLAGAQGRGPASQAIGGGVTVGEDVLWELYALLDQYYAESSSETDRSGLQASIQELLGSQSSLFSATA